MRHYLNEFFAPCLKWPWTHLMDVPELDAALVEKIAEQSDAQAGDRSIRELERIRDDNLVAIIRALRNSGAAGWGAGAVLAEHERRAAQTAPGLRPSGLRPSGLRLLEAPVQPQWLDEHGYLSDTGYADILCQSIQALCHHLGMNTAHFGLRMDQLKLNRTLDLDSLMDIYCTVRPIAWDDVRLQTFHQIHRQADGQLLATAEMTSIHMDLRTRRECPVEEPALERLKTLAEARPAPPH